MCNGSGCESPAPLSHYAFGQRKKIKLADPNPTTVRPPGESGVSTLTCAAIVSLV